MRLIPVRLGRISRRLLRAPGFTLVAVITLALGIGANTAIFSVVRGVLLKPLHFADSGSLVGVWHSAPGIGIRQVEQSPATYFTYREEGRAFEDIGLWGAEPVSITGAGDPERVQALLVTVSAMDPATYDTVALGLAATALVASYLPAHRASRVDPAAALRWEA